MMLLRVTSWQVKALRSTRPRSLTSMVSASCQLAVKSRARMKARRVMAFCTGKGAGNLRLQRGGSKHLRPRLHELDPDHVALFPGDLARPAGRCPVELQLKLRLDELRVLDPEPGA